MSTSFAQLGVPEYIIRALARRGYDKPFPIQAATIADALDGHDLCGRAPTGSGKTLAFGIPLVAQIKPGEDRLPRGLVLSPTRELADQIADELRTFGGKATIVTVYGGVGYGKQESTLRRGADIVVGCPGRLEDLIERGSLDLSHVDHVVIDEADRLADMGFFPAVRRLLQATDRDRQIVLFSATLDGDVAKLTRDFQHDPVTHEVGAKTPDITNADHQFWQVRSEQRVDAAAQAIGTAGPAVVFCRTRRGADRLAKQLGRVGVRAGAIHGGHAQNRRTRTLGEFTDGKLHALIATDVAARGIHVDDVATVIHFDPPEDHKTYVHRSGRTARAGQQGVVVSLVLPDQTKTYRQLKSKLRIETPFENPDIKARRQSAPSGGDQASGRERGDANERDNNSGSRAKNRNSRNKARNGGGRNGQGPKNRGPKANRGGSDRDRNGSDQRDNNGPRSERGDATASRGQRRDNTGSRSNRRNSGGRRRSAPASR